MNFSYTDIHFQHYLYLYIHFLFTKEVPDFYNLNSFEYIRVLRLENSLKQIV